MTREELRDLIQTAIERQLELVCRRAHTSPTYGEAPAIRVFADGEEFLVLIGRGITPRSPNPYERSEADPLAPLPGEIEIGRPCTPEQEAELERTEEW